MLYIWGFLAAVMLAMGLPACRTQNPVDAFLAQYHQGVVFTPGLRPFDRQLADMKELDINLAKFWLNWSEVQSNPVYYDPEGRIVSTEKSKDFRWPTRQDFLADPGLIEEYAHPEKNGSRFAGIIDWEKYDRIIFGLQDEGIQVCPLIGDATTAPFIKIEGSIRFRIAPEKAGWENSRCEGGVCNGYQGIGKDEYLDQIFLHTAGASRRYRGTVILWNTENELNWTPIHVLIAKWRMGTCWFDFAFLNRLLRTLHEAVHAGASNYALSTMNLNIHDPLWRFRLKDWEPCMDVVGLGAYPNYLFSRPVLDSLLIDAIKQARQDTKKPVMVMETGYPSGPAERGYSEMLQTDYMEKTTFAANNAGCLGYLWYRLDDPDTDTAKGLQAVEWFWGLVDNHGARKASYKKFQEINAFLPGCTGNMPDHPTSTD